MKDHLGNVRVTFSDLKLQPVQQDSFRLDLLTVNNYYPFGMLEADRNYSSSHSYRYGYNGMEKDNEIKGEGNSYDFGARLYDNRTIRFYSIDPKVNDYPSFSSYLYAGNSPIWEIDENGEFKKKFSTKEYPTLSLIIDKAKVYIENQPKLLKLIAKYGKINDHKKSSIRKGKEFNPEKFKNNNE